MLRLASWFLVALVLGGLALVAGLGAFVATVIGAVISMQTRFRRLPDRR
jgi:hypothetical protein